MILRLTARSSAWDRREIEAMPARRGDGIRVADDSVTLLWHALEAGATRAELVDRVAEELEIDRSGAAISTDRFLSQLRRRGLLVES